MVMQLCRRWLSDERRRFAVVFSAVAGCLLAFYYFPRTGADAVERWTGEYLRVYTQLASWPIALFDTGVAVHGNLIAGRFSMEIVKSCDAMEANILFTAAVLAFAAPWPRKIASLVVGLAVLAAVNVLRLFTLYWAGVFIPWAFEFMHIDLWPLLIIAFAAVDFHLCVRWMRKADRIGPGGVGGPVDSGLQVQPDAGEGHVAG